MLIEQVNTIAITAILNKLNFTAVQEDDQDVHYLSPFEEYGVLETLIINKSINGWYDSQLKKGGSLLDFAIEWLKFHNENHSLNDALRWINIMSGNAPKIASIAVPETNVSLSKSKLILKSVEPITEIALVRYLEKMGISFALAERYLQQVTVYNSDTKETICSLGIRNEDGGYTLHSQVFKGSIKKQNITFVRGTIPKPQGIHIFKDDADFYSVLENRGLTQFSEDAIILNSYSCLEKATPFIEGYGYRVAYTWLTNDDDGIKARQSLDDYFKTQEKLRHRPMNSVYAGNRSFTAWRMRNLNLAL